MKIADNPQLYAMIGATYGGDNVTDFNLPDLRGRVPIGTGLTTKNPAVGGANIIPAVSGNIPSGMTGGRSQVILTQVNLPAHSHPLAVSSTVGSAVSPDPTGKYLANTTSQDDGSIGLISAPVSFYSNSANTTAAPQAIGLTGGGQAVALQPPYLAINYIISLTGPMLPHS